jgi:bifunctional polynucleotide phosphatase/kinase
MAPTIIKLNDFRFRTKIASFDFDHTLVTPKDNRTFPKDIDDWQFIRSSVPEILKDYYDKGYCIIIFSNQTKLWKTTQIENVLKSLDIPVYISVAYDKDDKKPNTNMFDLAVSDWSDSDKLFANNIGINLKTPEEIFPFQKITGTVSESDIILQEIQEVIILVGYPGSGKSYLVGRIFNNNDQYVILSGDILKTSAKMIKNAKPLLTNGKSVIFDATNPTIAKRAEYIKLAQEYNIPVRCIYVSTSFEESLYRNNQRPKENIVPKIAYYVYRKKFEMPTKEENMEVIIV